MTAVHGGLRQEVHGAAGFSTLLHLGVDELARVRALVEAHWLRVLEQHAPQHAAAFAERGLARYHELAHRIDHAALWPKASRILRAGDVAEIRQMPFMHRIAEELGEFEISDEEEVGWEEIYFRLVRPRQPDDVGPLHADRWFWDLGHGVTPPGVERIKVWGAVVCEPGRNGLRLVPGSHRRSWRYHGEERHGMLKPQIDEDESRLDIVLLSTQPGDVVVFNDALLHGGAYNAGETTRVSFEMTLFVRAAGRDSVESDCRSAREGMRP